MMLEQRLAELNVKRAEVQGQDLDAYVEEKVAELRKQIRAQAEQAQAYELKVLDIRIEAFNEALELVKAEADKAPATDEEVAKEVANGTM